ncbi:hypothetical protein AURDEDRAFT_177297 [Auricularia subglabra TFB-10046 SS5]|uniref:Uncharacterized protein n=1 Tax=Auricularia subglabra (strain TFB-10046 / SS5) TaxID=717982 RepID=J0LB17_AURST|nr:hypothetical protein AURDEDRAFT_177297 [Auricularia subglabra TFB-10046 SS5]
MPSAKGSGPPPPPSAMGKTGSLKSRFSFGRPASISLSEASILSLSVGPTPSPQPAPEPVPVPVKVPPARPSEDTVVAIERKSTPQTSPVLRTPSSLGRASTRSRVSFDAPFVHRPSLNLAHLRPVRHSPSSSPSPLRHLPSFVRASRNSSALDLSSLQFSRDEITVPVGDLSAETTGGTSFKIDELDPDLALLLQPGAAVTSSPAQARHPARQQPSLSLLRRLAVTVAVPWTSAGSRPRGGSLSTRRQPAISISRPGTAPPTEDGQRNFFARRLGIKHSTSVEDLIQPSPSPAETRRAGRAPLGYGALDYGSAVYTPARPSIDRESPRPSIDTFTTSLRARRGELSASERTAGSSEYSWEHDEWTWRLGEFGEREREREVRSKYGGARSEFTGSGSGGARSEYSARSEFRSARSASEYAGPIAAWRRALSPSPSPTPTATRTVTSGMSSSSTAYLSDELERLRSKHAAETEALLAALGDAQRSARVLRDENERRRARHRENESLRSSRGASPSPTPSPSLATRPAVARARTSPIPRIVHPPPTLESSFDSDVSLDLNLDDTDALDAQIRLVRPLVPNTPRRHAQSASGFAMSIPHEGQSLLPDALPDSDAEPDPGAERSVCTHQVSRSPSHAILYTRQGRKKPETPATRTPAHTTWRPSVSLREANRCRANGSPGGAAGRASDR